MFTLNLKPGCLNRLTALLLTGPAGLGVSAALAQTPYVNIDSPVTNSVVPGMVKVYGWSIDNLSAIGPIISGVTVQANGPANLYVGAGYGLPLYQAGYTNALRPDVSDVNGGVYPNRAGAPYVGFESDITAGTLAVGAYSFTVTASASGQPSGSATMSNVYVEPVLAPTNLSFGPSGGTGTAQTFTFTATTSNAPPGGDIGTMWVLFNTPANGLNGVNACYFSFTPASNSIVLVNDAGNAWAYSGAIGNGGVVENSQCNINLNPGATTWSYDPNNHILTLNTAITFKLRTYGTTQNVWAVSFQQQTWATTGWAQLAVWTVPATPAPTISSLSTGFAQAGTPVVIAGSNFGTAGSVTFNGVTAPITGWGPGSITTSVPFGANSGPVVVSVNGAASNPIDFIICLPGTSYVDYPDH